MRKMLGERLVGVGLEADDRQRLARRRRSVGRGRARARRRAARPARCRDTPTAPSAGSPDDVISQMEARDVRTRRSRVGAPPVAIVGAADRICHIALVAPVKSSSRRAGVAAPAPHVFGGGLSEHLEPTQGLRRRTERDPQGDASPTQLVARRRLDSTQASIPISTRSSRAPAMWKLVALLAVACPLALADRLAVPRPALHCVRATVASPLPPLLRSW